MITKENKPTNKQGVVPDTHRHHHKQGLTCDCRNCGVEFKQYHRRHIYCSQECEWEKNGTDTFPQTCNDCGCTDTVPSMGRGYVCNTCRKLRLNRTRTDVAPRKP